MSLFEKRVEAAAKALRELPYFNEGVSSLLLESWSRMVATTALKAADAVCCAHPKCPGGSLCCCQSDAVVTEEMIEQVVLLSESKQEVAQSVAMLFRGGAK